jgi:tetratricopeptide (TPR) repeat protein
LKQGKSQEAIAAYQKALEQKPEPKQAAKLHRKMAQAYLEQGKDAEAQSLIKAVLDSAKQTEAVNTSGPKPAEMPRSSLPAKLIIVAPKRFLDQVGTGQVSVEAFKKMATVEYVNFPAEQR